MSVKAKDKILGSAVVTALIMIGYFSFGGHSVEAQPEPEPLNLRFISVQGNKLEAVSRDPDVDEEIVWTPHRLPFIPIGFGDFNATIAVDPKTVKVGKDEVPVEYILLKDANNHLVLGFRPPASGRYVLFVASGDKTGIWRIKANLGPQPPPEPDDDDDDDEDDDDDPPKPEPDDSPLDVSGLHVFIVYERTDTDSLRPGHQEIIFSTPIRQKLNELCTKLPSGSSAWRIADQNDDLSNVEEVWQKAMDLPRDSLPWVVIAGKDSGYTGPLQETVDAFLQEVEKYK